MNRTLAIGAVPAGRYCVRAGGPADSEAIRAFLNCLSLQTRFFRFFTAVGPTAGLLRILSGGTPGIDVLVISDANGAIVGHGMAAEITTGEVTADGRRGIDIGLVIADSWQGQGLGTVLLRLLVARAADRGIGAVLVEVLPDNARMLGLIEQHFPLARRTWNGDAISVVADISRATRLKGADREPHPAAA